MSKRLSVYEVVDLLTVLELDDERETAVYLSILNLRCQVVNLHLSRLIGVTVCSFFAVEKPGTADFSHPSHRISVAKLQIHDSAYRKWAVEDLKLTEHQSVFWMTERNAIALLRSSGRAMDIEAFNQDLDLVINLLYRSASPLPSRIAQETGLRVHAQLHYDGHEFQVGFDDTDERPAIPMVRALFDQLEERRTEGADNLPFGSWQSDDNGSEDDDE